MPTLEQVTYDQRRELVKLRAHIEEWRRIDKQHRIGHETDLHTIIGLNKQVATLTAENERLREALLDIAALDPLTQGDIAIRRAAKEVR